MTNIALAFLIGGAGAAIIAAAGFIYWLGRRDARKDIALQEAKRGRIAADIVAGGGQPPRPADTAKALRDNDF